MATIAIRDFEVQVDDADMPLISQYCWHVGPHGEGVWYAQTYIDGLLTLMHRLITAADPHQEVSHRDGNGLNNQRHNLRLATHSQALRNSRKHCESSSRFKGVYRSSSGRFVAQVTVNGTRYRKRGFDSEVDAARWYDDAARRYGGEFARTNADLGLLN